MPAHRGAPVAALLIALLFASLPGLSNAGAGIDTVLVGRGEAPDDWFGVALAGGGDVDGDGFTDWIAGAYSNDAGGIDAGRAYLFLGGAVLDSVPDAIFTGTREDYFGTAVALFDWNRDGYADAIVGSPAHDRSAQNAGSVYVFLGGPAFDTTPDAILSGEAAGDFFGQAVASAGDLDGDGALDLAVGAWKNGAAGKDAGRAYVYRGGAALDTVPDLVLTGDGALDNFGLVVCGGGDVDGDGFGDLVVGAPLFGADNRGRVFVYRGGPTLSASPWFSVTGEPFANLGWAVAIAPDWDGDGYDDVLAGAPFGGPTNAGRVLLFRGGMAPDSVADLVLEGEAASDRFGFAIAAADANGDGHGDVIAGAPFHDPPAGPNIGRASVFFGGADLDAHADLRIDGEAAFGNAGFAVALAGDVDHDGRVEMMVGAPLSAHGGASLGMTTLYSVDHETATELRLFQARAGLLGIEVVWQLVLDPGARAWLERAERREGPWRGLEASPREEGHGWWVLDADVVAGRRYLYRLRLEEGDRSSRMFGPIEVTAGLPAERFDLAVTPNPVREKATIACVLPRGGSLAVEVLDAAGRRVASLAQGFHPAGSHRMVWTPSRHTPPGAYFVTLRGPGVLQVRRVLFAR